MKSFDKCPICGGELKEKEVEKILKGDVNTAVIWVKAEVCLACGERLYTEDTVRRFKMIRRKLAQEDVADFLPLGQSFQVA